MKIKILSALIFVGLLFVATSCNNYLDEVPDNRTEIDTPEKVGETLVSAYTMTTPVMLAECMSDNMTDNGRRFLYPQQTQFEAYNFMDITSISTSSPYAVWEQCYKAVAHANAALEAIEAMGFPAETEPFRGEALLCRAFGHFLLATTFCQPYHPQTAATDLGLPYAVATEKTAINTYERGTLADLYASIERDILQGIPLLRDDVYTQPAYHFTQRAAWAFAANFFLHYDKPELTIEYADRVLGTADEYVASLRDMDIFGTFTARREFTNEWVRSTAPANLLIVAGYGSWGRTYGRNQTYSRYGNNNRICSTETLRSPGPWGDNLPVYDRLYGHNYDWTFPKCDEFFVITNTAAQTGSTYNVWTPFTIEKTLMDRAEAYIYMGRLDEVARDLNNWYAVKGGGSNATVSSIVNWYTTAKDSDTNSGQVKEMTPIRTLSNDQLYMLHGVLHARRIETMHEGIRIQDIRRLGIRFTHEVDYSTDIVLAPRDPRLTVQVPEFVISAGMKPNPRN